jgi:hypothetical protein
MEFTSKDEALAYHSDSINAGMAQTQEFLEAVQATESLWRSAHPNNGRAARFYSKASRLEALARGMATDHSRPADLLERALWQRDVVCGLQAVLHCQDIERHAVQAAQWQRIKDALEDLLEQLVFNESEYDKLKAELRSLANSAGFVSQCRYRLTDNYLPSVVFASTSDWHPFPSDEDPELHYLAYGGRCFVRTFIRAPGMSRAEFLDYWQKVTRRFGMNVTVSAAVPRLPAGTETVLLRTFGVFLSDGSYADSGIPEEVLVRVFKYAEATLDPQTSDGLGTLHYQYKLRRASLLEEPATLGLTRIKDNDGQFYGFFAEVPEPESSEHLTTMRANCISCHSELLYGASTVFSLCRHTPVRPDAVPTQGGLMERFSPRGWLIKQEALHTIQRELMARLRRSPP